MSQLSTDYTDHWSRYWERQYESPSRTQLVATAADPYNHWLLADLGELTTNEDHSDEKDEEEPRIELGHIRRYPDAVLQMAREGFEQFLETEDIDRVGCGYDQLPIHLIGLPPRTRDHGFRLDDPVSGANVLSTLPNVPVRDVTERQVRAASVTYPCPDGHETTITQPVYRTRRIERRGRSWCTNEVHPVDRKTRVRTLCPFDVTFDGEPPECIATGSFADRKRDLTTTSSRVTVLGIVRLRTELDHSVTPVYEVLNVQPT